MDEHNPSLNWSGDELLRGYAARLGGESVGKGRVVTHTGDWTVVVDHIRAGEDPDGRRSPWQEFLVWTRFQSPHDFTAKIEPKSSIWHDVFGRIFGSRDIDIGDREAQRVLCVEGNDPDKVRELFAAVPLASFTLIKKLEVLKLKEGYELRAEGWVETLDELQKVHDLVFECVQTL